MMIPGNSISPPHPKNITRTYIGYENNWRRSKRKGIEMEWSFMMNNRIIQGGRETDSQFPINHASSQNYCSLGSMLTLWRYPGYTWNWLIASRCFSGWYWNVLKKHLFVEILWKWKIIVLPIKKDIQPRSTGVWIHMTLKFRMVPGNPWPMHDPSKILESNFVTGEVFPEFWPNASFQTSERGILNTSSQQKRKACPDTVNTHKGIPPHQ